MSIKYTPPPTIDTEDDGYFVASADTLNFGNNITAMDDGYGTVTVDAGDSTTTVEDDGITKSTTVDTLNFRRNLKVDGVGSNTAIDGYLRIDEDNVFVDDAYMINFVTPFQVTTDGYGKVMVDITGIADVSPGFTWGDSGSKKSAYLLNDTVPSNKAGRVVPADGTITEVTVAVENIPSGNPTIEIQSRVGAIFTTIVTVPVSTSSRITIYSTSIDVDGGAELSCFVGNRQLFNPVVSVAVSAR